MMSKDQEVRELNSARKLVVIVAWLAMLLSSDILSIVWHGLLGRPNLWLNGWHFMLAVELVILALVWGLSTLRALRGYVAALVAYAGESHPHRDREHASLDSLGSLAPAISMDFRGRRDRSCSV